MDGKLTEFISSAIILYNLQTEITINLMLGAPQLVEVRNDIITLFKQLMKLQCVALLVG